MSHYADALSSLDLSGNFSLGNQGALHLLQACTGRLWMGASSQLCLGFNGCGIESPLSEEFVRVVDGFREADPVIRVDLQRNSFSQRDKDLLLDYTFCTLGLA